jgi:multiple sugar transport system substrate-binding protein
MGQKIQPTKRITPPALSRRKFLHLAGAAVGWAVASACAPFQPSPAPPAEEEIQLVYSDWRTEWFPPMAQEMLERFHAEHPSIHVFYTPDPENFQERMLADFQAGTAPDVFQGCCTHFPAWAQMGYTLDLRAYVEADLDEQTIGDWDPAQYQALFARDGHQFGLPKYHGAMALYYNRDIFDEYGVNYPDDAWDHADYLEAMKRLTHDHDGDGKTDLWGSMLDISWSSLQIHVNGWGGYFVDPDDPALCLMCEPEAMQALEWIRARMWDDRVMATPLDVQNLWPRYAFTGERVAMVEDGSWALKDILAEADFRIGVAPFPAGPIRRATLATTDGFGIYAETRHPDAAWELIRFLTSIDYGRAMARANFLQPARASLIGEWVGFVREEFPQQAEDVDIAAFADAHIKGYSVTAEIFTNMAGATQLANAAWDEIFVMGQPLEERIKTACQQIQEAQTQ